MPLVSDATALVALGEIGSISLLRHVASEVVISPWVRDRELRKFQAQIDLGIADEWIRVQEPSATEVGNLIQAASSFEIDRGEAETLVIARHQGTELVKVLIDEGEAHTFVTRSLIGRGAVKNWSLVCLADILHELEASGQIASAAEVMHGLQEGGCYRWARPVRVDYIRRCQDRELEPLP